MSKPILAALLVGALMASGLVAAVNSSQQGYTADQAKELNANWTLGQFLGITPAGGYSYLHLAEQFPTAVIYRHGPVKELPVDRRSRLGDISVPTADGVTTLNQLVAEPSTPLRGLVVIQNGAIVFERYPGMRVFDNHVWMSVAKPIASLLIAQLEDEGLVDVNQTVASYVTDAEGTNWESIKIIDVLNMQTGLDLVEDASQRANKNSGFARFMLAEAGLANADGQLQSHDEALFAIGPLKPPGKAFEYSSANTQMLGLIIEAVTGERLADVITKRLWMKVGMQGDAQLGLSPQGNGIIHGLVSSRLMDLARFGLLYTQSWGVVANERLVSAPALSKIYSSGAVANYTKGTIGRRMAAIFGESGITNAYQWDAVFTDGDIYKGGMNGQGLYISPADDIVIAWFANGYTATPVEAIARSLVKTLAPE